MKSFIRAAAARRTPSSRASFPLSWAELEETREHVQGLLDSFLFGIALLDEKLRIRAANRTARTMLGLAGGIRGKRLARFLPPEESTLYDGVIARIARGERSLKLEHGILRPDGSRREAECFLTSFPMHENSGALIALVLTDVTERLEMQRRCEASEKRCRALFEAAADAVMLVSSRGVLLEVNDMICRRAGYDREKLTGRDMGVLFPPAYREGVAACLAEALSVKEARTFETLLFDISDPMLAEISMQRVESLDKTAVLCIARDIKEHKLLRARLEFQASTDSLTALYNRRYFLSRAEEEFLRFKRYGTGFAMLMLDLDHFKNVNDTYGHHTGDALLREFARQLRRMFRHSDVLGRIGGEEFCVLLLESGPEQSMETAERLRLKIASEPLRGENGSVPYTVSIGVTVALDTDESLETIMRRADAAMYSAKHNGRNRVERAVGA